MKRATVFAAATAIVVCAIVAAAHSQQRYEHWTDTRTGWHGQTRQQGGNVDSDAYGPNGQQRHCHSYQSGADRYTTCR